MKKENPFTKRHAETSSVKNAIEEMLNAYKLRGKYDENRLIASWESLMGKPIAKRTLKIYIKNKVLYVQLNSAPLRHELTLAKLKVLDIIHQNFASDMVVDVKFY